MQHPQFMLHIYRDHTILKMWNFHMVYYMNKLAKVEKLKLFVPSTM